MPHILIGVSLVITSLTLSLSTFAYGANGPSNNDTLLKLPDQQLVYVAENRKIGECTVQMDGGLVDEGEYLGTDLSGTVAVVTATLSNAQTGIISQKKVDDVGFLGGSRYDQPSDLLSVQKKAIKKIAHDLRKAISDGSCDQVNLGPSHVQ